MVQFFIEPTELKDQINIENMLDQAFGLERRTKTSYRLREGEQEISDLSFVARDEGGSLAGSISFWHLKIGIKGDDAILLGPLAVADGWRNYGVGLSLMETGLAKAKELGHTLVLLVGDLPYYARAGFKQVPTGRLLMPGPVDEARLLYHELQSGAFDDVSGLVLSPGRATP